MKTRTASALSRIPSSPSAGLAPHPTRSGDWTYDVRLKRPDGSTFRRAGSAPSEAEARRRRDAAFAEFNSDMGYAHEQERAERRGTLVYGPATTLSRWIDYCVDRVWIGAAVAPSTAAAYRYNLRRHVVPEIGETPLAELTVATLRPLMARLHSRSSYVYGNVRSALATCLDVAVAEGKLPSNPVRLIKLGKRDRRVKGVAERSNRKESKRILSSAERRKVIEAARGTDVYVLVLLGVRFGLRIGEACGLLWENVDVDDKTLHVNQQLTYATGQQTVVYCGPSKLPKGCDVGPTKYDASDRSLPIPDDLVDELRRLKAAATSDFVSGKAYNPTTVNDELRVVFEAAELGDGPRPSFHDLRSSWASWLANDVKVMPQDLMALMGHRDIQTTMQHYVRADQRSLRDAVNTAW
jgi:integrase